MAAIAPDATESAAPRWLGSFLETWEPGTGAPIEDREPATGRHLATIPGSTPGRRRARRRGREGRPARLGRDELPGAGARPAPSGRDLRREPRRVRDLDAARDRRLPQQDASRVELRLPRDPQRGDPAVAGLRLADAVRGQGPAVDGPPRAGGRHRRDHAVELAVRARDARRGAGPRARQRGRPQAGSADAGRGRRDVRGGLPRGGPARGPAPGRGRRRGRRRGAGHRPEHPGRVVHRLDGRRAAGRPAGRRHAQEGLARARWEQRVHRARRRRPRRGRRGRARSRRSSSRARSASPPDGTSSTAASRTTTPAP